MTVVEQFPRDRRDPEQESPVIPREWISIALRNKWIEISERSGNVSACDIKNNLTGNKWPAFKKKAGWEWLREGLLHERGYKCGYCDGTIDGSFHLHHKSYSLGDNPYQMDTVHPECHTSIHHSTSRQTQSEKLGDEDNSFVQNRRKLLELHTETLRKYRDITFAGNVSRNPRSDLWIDYDTLDSRFIHTVGKLNTNYQIHPDSDQEVPITFDAFGLYSFDFQGVQFDAPIFLIMQSYPGTFHRRFGHVQWNYMVQAIDGYFDSERYKQDFGCQSGRVLVVTNAGHKRWSVKSQTEQSTTKGRFWFSSFADIEEKDAFRDSIWIVSGDYHQGDHKLFPSSERY